MKDKIAEVLIPYMRDSERYAIAQAILDLIAEHYIPKDQDLIKLFKTWVLKQLPKEKVCCCNEEELEAWWCSCGAEVHNKTVKDIKHKLGVE